MVDERKDTDKKSSDDDDDINLDDKSLGIAGRITRQFINSPVTPLLMMAALVVGLMGLFFTPRQEDPKISVPMVDIFVQYPGASAEQVTSLVTEPLERIMSEIPGVRHVYSATRRGAAIVTVRFLVGEEMGESIVKVHDKVQSNLDKIPPGVDMPLVKPMSIDDVPVVTATLWSDAVDDAALRTLALDVLQRLNEVPDTGKGFIVGGRSERIRVEVMPERLSGYGISLDQVAQTIRTANAERSAGSVETGGRSFTVYSGSFLRGAEDVSRLVVGSRGGAPIYVRDVARVTQGPEETDQMVLFYTGPAWQEEELASGVNAVTIAISKKVDTNGVTVANAILNRLEALKGQLIPNNVNVTITRNYGKTANDKVNELLKALFEAAVAVAILCLIGLGARAAFVVITVIPIVVLLTVWSAWVLGYTVDRVSLFALVFAIGILVDDATVVVENIFRRWLEAGKTSVALAVDAVREVGNPTILATLTIIAALLPMGFVSGLMGPYMRPIPVLGSSAMMFSLLAAFMFTPWFTMRVRPRLKALKKAERREEKTRRAIGKFYRPIMRPLINNRFIGWVFMFSLIALTLISCALFYFKIVPVKMLPFDNKPEFNVVINMPEGTALPETANVTHQLSMALMAVPEVTAMQAYIGTASPMNFNGLVRHYYLREEPWQSDIQVMLKDKKEREAGSHDLAVEARHILAPLAERLGARIQVVEMPPGPPVLQTVVAEIYGPNAGVRRQFARDLTAMFDEVDNVVDVDNYMIEPHEYWRFEVDTEKAVRRGISVDAINRNLAMALGGHKLGDVKRGVVLEPTYIVIEVPLSSRSQINRMASIPMTGPDGNSVPLTELGRFVRGLEDPVVYHKDLRPVEYVTGEMEGRLGAPIYGMNAIEDLLDDYVAPDGVKVTGMPGGLIGPPDDDSKSGIEWSGEWTVTYETFRDMGLAFMAALLLIYGLIVWEFKNFALGGLIMAPIPLTLIGIIPGHWVLGAQFTATSMIGFIALAGIIVRNSILLVEFVRLEVLEGQPIREAVVRAGQTRMRPIFITSLTLMAGAFMILQDPIFKGMAVSLLFGAGVATVLTLVVIPLGAISARKQFYLITGKEPTEEDKQFDAEDSERGGGRPLWIRVWGMMFTVLTWIFYLLRGMVLLLVSLVKGWIAKRRAKSGSGGDTPPPPTSPPPSGGGTPPAPASGGPGAAAPVGSAGRPAPAPAPTQASAAQAPAGTAEHAAPVAGAVASSTPVVTEPSPPTSPLPDDKIESPNSNGEMSAPTAASGEPPPATETSASPTTLADSTQNPPVPEVAQKSANKATAKTAAPVARKKKSAASKPPKLDGSADSPATADGTSPLTPSSASASRDSDAPAPKRKRRGIRINRNLTEDR